jgi:HemY protein
MRWLISLIVVIVLAVTVGLTARYAQGYVLFVMPRTRVEMSLTLFVLLLLFGFALSYALVRTLRHLWQLPARVQAYRLHRNRNRARSAMQEAMSAYLEGHFERAEKAAAKAMRLQESPQLGSALAAQAAQARGQADQSEQYLAFGEAEAKQPSRLLQMTRASLLHQRGAHDEALRMLEVIIRDAPKYIPAVRLALQCHQSLNQWSEVERTAAQLSQLGQGQDPLVRDALQAAGKRAREAPTRPAQSTGESLQGADIVALRPRQGGYQ